MNRVVRKLVLYHRLGIELQRLSRRVETLRRRRAKLLQPVRRP